MSFNVHIHETVNKSVQILGLIKRICKEMKFIQTLRTLYLSLVGSNLMCASCVWSSYFNVHIEHMESVHDRFFRIMTPRLGLSNPIVEHVCSKIASKLWISSLKTLGEFNGLKFLFKFTNGFVDCPALLGYLKHIVPVRRGLQNYSFVIGNHNHRSPTTCANLH